MEEKGGFAKIAGGNSANYATSSQNAAAVTAYVEHAIARCIPLQQLEDGIKNPWLMTVSYFHGPKWLWLMTVSYFHGPKWHCKKVA